MKRLTILFIGIIYCSVASAQELQQSQIDFASDFLKAIQDHDRNKIIRMMNKEYRKAQIKFLNRNKVQFVDELFSGVDMLSDTYVTVNLEDIIRAEIAEVEKIETNVYVYVLRVRDTVHDVSCSLTLKKIGMKYSFIGGSG